jgi:serine/threonine-protein kinase HipA
MAMALRGKNRHYHWARIMHRHWLGTAHACRFPADEMAAIIDGLLDRMDGVIQTVTDQLSPSFPADVAGPSLDGMREARNRLIRSRH